MLWLGALLSFALCFCLVPSVIALSWRIGAVDVPRDWRRMHHKSVPRAGGIAIFLAFAISCAVFGEASFLERCALSGGALLLLLGLADDIFCLDAWVKLFFQVAIASASVLGCGVIRPENAFVAIFWVIALTNAHNFIDGLDGLFAGCASIEGAALAAVFLLLGELRPALSPLLLAASCLAFRHYNRHPARLFAGDCGSGTVGFLLGMFSLPLLSDLTPRFALLTPLLLFAYPLTDLFTAVVRRMLRGKSPFAADRAHFHHRICAAGLTHPQCAGVLLLICLGLASLGVALATDGCFLLGSLLSLCVALLLIRIRQFILDFS